MLLTIRAGAYKNALDGRLKPCSQPQCHGYARIKSIGHYIARRTVMVNTGSPMRIKHLRSFSIFMLGRIQELAQRASEALLSSPGRCAQTPREQAGAL